MIFYFNRLSTVLEFWFACASIAWDACVRTLFFVYAVISFAISASRMVDSDACTFYDATTRLLLVYLRRFCTAPILTASSVARIKAFSNTLIAAFAASRVVT